MVLVLPFLTVLIAAWYIWKRRQRAATLWWLLTMVIYIIWLIYHSNTTLDLSF
ncbi:DUF5993 family protein [Microbulbifer variabilis]|uniref:DUF5993 family protein n=1 Tax=Microbulbifer variabilis TaxID=266805 RepID=A0ABY4VF45_9GAMM|nr:DUF5993 family protein [Microbulbifer variabilis]USD21465.1 DUF5993 family protein [Microbulbifer variabilis]